MRGEADHGLRIGQHPPQRWGRGLHAETHEGESRFHLNDQASAANDAVNQPPYMYGTTQVECLLKCNTKYFIVPSLYTRGMKGDYYITVYCENDFSLEGGVRLSEEPMKLPNSSGHDEPIKLTNAQFFEKKEAIREKIVQEAKKLGVGMTEIASVFEDIMGSDGALSRARFKSRMMDIGFSFQDLTDKDIIVLDVDNSGTISKEEFKEFMADGLEFADPKNIVPPPAPPVDDLLFQSIDLEGTLSCAVAEGSALRKASTWFSPSDEAASTEGENGAKNGVGTGAGSSSGTTCLNRRSKLIYDNEAAAAALVKAQGTTETLANFYTRWHEDYLFAHSDEGLKARAHRQTLMMQGATLLRKDSMLDGPESPMKDAADGVSNMGKSLTAGGGANSRQERVKELAGRLHEDQFMMTAEVRRMTNLQRLMKQKRDSAEKNTQLDSNALRRTTKVPRPAKRRIHNDTDVAGMLNKNLIPLSHQTSPRAVSLNEHVDNAQDTNTVTDIWDFIIDQVFTIHEGKVRGGNPKPISFATPCLIFSNDEVSALREAQLSRTRNPLTSAIPTPRTGSLQKSRGSAISAKNRKSLSASQSHTPREGAGASTAGAVLDAVPKLQAIVEDKAGFTEGTADDKSAFVEVYRRVHVVPQLSRAHIEGNRRNKGSDTGHGPVANSKVEKLFRKFDKNHDGLISKMEFKETLGEFGIKMTDQEMEMLFSRFETNVQDGNIDWQEFMAFYTQYLAPYSSLTEDTEDEQVKLLTALQTVKKRMSSVLKEMEKRGVVCLDKWLLDANDPTDASESAEQELDAVKEEASPDDTGKHASMDKSIFTGLTLALVPSNTKNLRACGITITELQMARISRIFDFDVSKLMAFIQDDTGANLKNAYLTATLLFNHSIKDAIESIWASISPCMSSMVEFDKFASCIFQRMKDQREGKTPIVTSTDGGAAEDGAAATREAESSEADGGEAKVETDGRAASLMAEPTFHAFGLNAALLSRLIVDNITFSAWNKY